MTTQEIINDMRAHTITSMRAAADKLEQLQRLNDSMQTDRDLWIKVGREKLEAVEKKLTDSTNHYNAIIIELARERDETCAEVERLKLQNDQLRQGWSNSIIEGEAEGYVTQSIRPEPSRLEIAAMLKAGWFANRAPDFNATDDKWWIEQADALIAAAREGKLTEIPASILCHLG